MAKDDYRALDLSAFCNAGVDVLGDALSPRGDCTYYGLPFRIGSGEAEGHDLIVFGERDVSGPLTVPISERAHNVVFAHAMLETDLFRGGPAATKVADYELTYADGSSVKVPVRERIEIAVRPQYWEESSIPLDWGQFPLAAYLDAEQQLMPRDHGRYDDAGVRQTEIFDPQSREPYVLPYTYYVWIWRNPHPDRVIEGLTVVPAGPRFCIAGVTLGLVDEDPIARTAASTVLCSAPEGVVEDLEVQVDRGYATYAYPVVTEGPDDHDPEELIGWGRQRRQPRCRAYTRISANPSATVALKAGDKLIGECSWGELASSKIASVSGDVELRVVDENVCWVRTTVLDEATGEPVPCRIHFRSASGVPYPPYGHHAHINSEMKTWNWDIGGDLRLGAVTYAYIDGSCEGWLPEGEIIVEVARGYEYEPVRRTVSIQAGQTDLEIRLHRIIDMRAKGYVSGDSHVHFISTTGAALEARGEDVHIVNLLMSQWSHLYTNTEDFVGKPYRGDHDVLVWAGQESRQQMLGHMGLLGLREQIMPWCTAGAEEAELGGGIQTTMSYWADECHEQGGLVVLSHFPVPYGEVPVLIVTGRGDAVEMIAGDEYNHLEYYRYLNCGYRLPLVAGTDKMTSEVAIGQFRAYSRVDPDAELTHEAWRDGVRRGDTFVSSGPLLSFSVDGRSMGSVLKLQHGDACDAEVEAVSTMPLHCLQLVCNGRVIAEATSREGVRRLELREKVHIDGDSWLAARCGGRGYFSLRHHDTWRRESLAHTSPVYVTVQDEYDRFDPENARHIMALIEGGLVFLRERSVRFWPGRVQHRHGETNHLAHLERPFMQARDMLAARAKAHGITL